MRPHIAVSSTSSRLELDALIRLDRLSAVHPRAVLRIGLSAVIEASDRTLSYWALRHPTDKPDFHNADSFALLLYPPASVGLDSESTESRPHAIVPLPSREGVRG